MKELANKTILVTGGAGSIGSEIVKQALKYKVDNIIVLDIDEIKSFILKKRISDDRVKITVGDIRDYRSLKPVFDTFDIDIIYHVAAMKHVVVCEDAPIEAVKTNVYGTQNIIDLAIEYKIPKTITISTDKAANPQNVMGMTKFIAERITLNANNFSKNNQAFSCVRFGNVANTRGSVIPIFIDNLLNNNPIVVTDPNVTRFVMRMSDSIDLIFKATKYALGREIFIFKMDAFKLGDLVDVIKNRIATRLKISKKDLQIKTMGLCPGEKLHEDLIGNLELNNVYELDGMYAIIPKNNNLSKYPNTQKVKLSSYTSNTVKLISKDEIEKIVTEYLQDLSVKF